MKWIAVFLLLLNAAALYAQEETSPQVATADTLVVVLQAADTPVHDTIAATAPAAAPKHKTLRENKKLVAAICALPPFGLIGLHRIYLHSAPYVPVVYLCTLGGAGVLTMIDFVFILVKTPEEIEAEFEGNNRIFMWVK